MRVTVHSAPPPEAVELLRRTTWGTPGGVRYQQVHHDWSRLVDAEILLFHSEAGEVVATQTLTPGPWGFLRQLLAVAPERQGEGWGKHCMRWVRAHYEPRLGPGQVLLGTIETTNRRSYSAAVDAGYSQVATYEARTFTRRWPRASSRVRPAGPDDLDWMLAAHGSPTWSVADRSLRTEEVFVLEEGGQPVAAVQAVLHQWRIVELAGSELLRRALSVVAGVSADDFGYLGLHTAVGEAAPLQELVEHVLAHHDVHAAMLVTDADDARWRQVARAMSWGVAGRAAGAVPVAVMASGPVQGPLDYPLCFSV